jgi:mannan endo-1,4-beta-mannosidase
MPSVGGTTGGGGARVARPAYNTGMGFFVAGGKLYDAQGVEFRIRGINKLHFDAPSPGIAKTHANAERWVLAYHGEYGSTTAGNLQLLQSTVQSHVVPIPGNWDGTCDESAATLTAIVDTWVAQAGSYTQLNPYMILNIANEWGPSSSTVWRDSYVTAIKRLRAAGYTCTLQITAGGCGQDNDDLVKYAQAVFDADPQKNVIFDQHIYGNWASDATAASWQVGFDAGLAALKATGLVTMIGEFGSGNGIGPSPTDLKPLDIIKGAEANGLGWMAWAWDDPAYNPNPSTDFALSMGAQAPYGGDYTSTNDLTPFGKIVVETPGWGLKALAVPQTAF